MRLTLARTRAKLLQQLRSPQTSIPPLGLPVMILGFFYIPHVQDSAVDATLQTGGVVVLAFTIATLHSLSIELAADRESPWKLFDRTLPVHGVEVFVPYLAVTFAIGIAGAAIAVLVALLTTPASLEAGLWPRAAVSLLAGLPAIGLLGIVIGYRWSQRAAVGIANLIFWPLAFASGLFLPPQQLPSWVADVSEYLPLRQWLELVRTAVTDQPAPWGDALGLAAWTAAFALVALVVYGRERRVAVR